MRFLPVADRSSCSAHVLLCLNLAAVIAGVGPTHADDLQWEAEIARFERLDAEADGPLDAILFTGSSSIRLWGSLPEDMAPHRVLARGFGGSTIRDVVHYADRILANHRPRAVVLFVANDIQGGPQEDRSAEVIAADFGTFVDRVHLRHSSTPIFIVAITPTARRWNAWPRIQLLNKELARLCDSRTNAIFIPTSDLFLNADDLPDQAMFQPDQLHLSTAGYAKWAKRIRSYLDPVVSPD